jgi:hypothetical protein
MLIIKYDGAYAGACAFLGRIFGVCHFPLRWLSKAQQKFYIFIRLPGLLRVQPGIVWF